MAATGVQLRRLSPRGTWGGCRRGGNVRAATTAPALGRGGKGKRIHGSLAAFLLQGTATA